MYIYINNSLLKFILLIMYIIIIDNYMNYILFLLNKQYSIQFNSIYICIYIYDDYCMLNSNAHILQQLSIITSITVRSCISSCTSTCVRM